MTVTRRGLLVGAGAAVGVAVVGRSSASAAPVEPLLHRIEGSDASALLLPGAVATVLLHVARRFSYEVSPLAAGDAAGTGTGITLLPGLGADGLFPLQVLVVRDILGECQGVVRWGGDDDLPCQGSFRLAVPAGDRRVHRLAATLPRAGGPVDVLDPARRAVAVAVAAGQAR